MLAGPFLVICAEVGVVVAEVLLVVVAVVASSLLELVAEVHAGPVHQGYMIVHVCVVVVCSCV